MGRISGTSRIVDVAGRSGAGSFVRGSLRRGRAPRLSATWLIAGVVLTGLTVTIAVRIADALNTPGLGGFPPIP